MIDLDEQKKVWESRDLRVLTYSQLFAPAISAPPMATSSLLEIAMGILVPRNVIAHGDVDPLERMYIYQSVMVGSMGSRGITPPHITIKVAAR